MTTQGWLQISVYGLVVLAITKPLGNYLYWVFADKNRPLPRGFGILECWTFQVCGVNPEREQNWQEYARALLLFSGVGVLVTYGILRLQPLLPLNPQNLGAVAPDLAFNTAVSFITNTNWQAYGGETTMSYFSQMAALAWQNFVSAAAGLAVALALARGLTRPSPSLAGAGGVTVGNFWVDVLRAIIYLFLPVCLVAALVLVSQGVIQTLSLTWKLTR
jgi:K+-transporting ATPase ATPase A chain